MQKQTTPQSLPFLVISLYFLPVLFFSIYSIGLMSEERSWIVLSTGLLLCSSCSILLITILQKLLQTPFVASPSETGVTTPIYGQDCNTETHRQLVADMEMQQERLTFQLKEKEQRLEQIIQDKENVEQQLQQYIHETKAYQDDLDAKAGNTERLCKEYDQTIREQRNLLERKQQHILRLENSVHELTSEVQKLVKISDLAHHASHQSLPKLNPFTALQAEDQTNPNESLYSFMSDQTQFPSSYSRESAKEEMPWQGPEDDAIDSLLKRCVDVAQRLTGASHFSPEESRFRALTVNSHALELRRLCDTLSTETSGIIILYSPKEEKLLFVSNQTKDLLGWSPDKFVQEFHTLIQEGLADWKHALIQLMSRNATQIRMQIKTKTGPSLTMQCHLGIIPTGIFKNHVIGVLKQV